MKYFESFITELATFLSTSLLVEVEF